MDNGHRIRLDSGRLVSLSGRDGPERAKNRRLGHGGSAEGEPLPRCARHGAQSPGKYQRADPFRTPSIGHAENTAHFGYPQQYRPADAPFLPENYSAHSI